MNTLCYFRFLRNTYHRFLGHEDVNRSNNDDSESHSGQKRARIELTTVIRRDVESGKFYLVKNPRKTEKTSNKTELLSKNTLSKRERVKKDLNNKAPIKIVRKNRHKETEMQNFVEQTPEGPSRTPNNGPPRHVIPETVEKTPELTPRGSNEIFVDGSPASPPRALRIQTKKVRTPKARLFIEETPEAPPKVAKSRTPPSSTSVFFVDQTPELTPKGAKSRTPPSSSFSGFFIEETPEVTPEVTPKESPPSSTFGTSNEIIATPSTDPVTRRNITPPDDIPASIPIARKKRNGNGTAAYNEYSEFNLERFERNFNEISKDLVESLKKKTSKV